MNLTGIKNLLRWRTAPHELGEKLINTNRVIEGLLVTAQGTPDMTVAVSAGLVRQAKATAFVAADAALAITAADATNPRIDLVVVTSAGALDVVDGTAAASAVAPALPAGAIELARVTVPANDTAIGQAQISFTERGQL